MSKKKKTKKRFTMMELAEMLEKTDKIIKEFEISRLRQNKRPIKKEKASELLENIRKNTNKNYSEICEYLHNAAIDFYEMYKWHFNTFNKIYYKYYNDPDMLFRIFTSLLSGTSLLMQDLKDNYEVFMFSKSQISPPDEKIEKMKKELDIIMEAAQILEKSGYANAIEQPIRPISVKISIRDNKNRNYSVIEPLKLSIIDGKLEGYRENVANDDI